MHAIKKKSKIWLRCSLPEKGGSFGSLSFKSLILVKKQELEQVSKCRGVEKYPRNCSNVHLNEATIVTSRRKFIKALVYSTDFQTESEYFQVRVRVLFEIKSFEYEYSEKLYSSVIKCSSLKQFTQCSIMQQSATLNGLQYS